MNKFHGESYVNIKKIHSVVFYAYNNLSLSLKRQEESREGARKEAIAEKL